MNLIKEILKNIKTIDLETNYWLVRSDSGRLYSSFRQQSVIAIGYSEIEIPSKSSYIEDYNNCYNNFINQIKQKYPDASRPGFIASQLLRLAYELKKGDIVIITSSGTNEISIGTVDDDEYSIKDIYYEYRGKPVVDKEFKKTRTVKWIKKVDKRKINSNLFHLFFSHQTIVDANGYSELIDSMLFDFFQKGNATHLILYIEKRDGINARELFGACLDLFDISDEIVENFNINETSSNVQSKINLNSPGEIEFISQHAPYIIALLGILVLMINGGNFKIKIEKLGLDLNLGTDGLIEKINRFLNSKRDRKLKETVEEKIKNLNIQSSKEISEIIDSINTKNQND